MIVYISVRVLRYIEDEEKDTYDTSQNLPWLRYDTQDRVDDDTSVNYNTHDASERVMSPYDAPQHYDASNISGYDVPNLSGYDTQNLSGYGAPNLSGYDTQNLSGYDAPNLSGYDAPNHSGYDSQEDAFPESASPEPISAAPFQFDPAPQRYSSFLRRIINYSR